MLMKRIRIDAVNTARKSRETHSYMKSYEYNTTMVSCERTRSFCIAEQNEAFVDDM